MTLEQALKIYLRFNVRAERTVGRLQQWESAKTARQNAITLGIPLSGAINLVRRYALSFKRSNAHRAIIPLNARLIRELREEGMALTRIARMYNVTKQAVDHALRTKKANRQ